MKVDFSEYDIAYCDYCKEKEKEEAYRRCEHCTRSDSYCDAPTRFSTNNELIKNYSALLSDYSKMLSNMGFEIIIKK